MSVLAGNDCGLSFAATYLLYYEFRNFSDKECPLKTAAKINYNRVVQGSRCYALTSLIVVWLIETKKV